MKLHFLGTCAGTEPMPGRNHQSFAIEIDNTLYWFDAGACCSITGYLMGLDLLTVKKVIISHVHMDHVGGLGNLFWDIRKVKGVSKKDTKFDSIDLYIPEEKTWHGILQMLENTEKGINRYEENFEIPNNNMEDFWDYIGISEFTPETDIDYAIKEKIKNIEIRKYEDPKKFATIIQKIDEWRLSGGKYLSVHLPNLKHTNGDIIGKEEWNQAIQLTCDLNADGVTIHVPRINIKDMIIDSLIWRNFLDIMVESIAKLPEKTKVGIENIHMPIGAPNTLDREFGCIPEECLLWIEALNRRFGFDRVGSTLDVGHATNNSVFNTRYTKGVWYEMLGSKTVAYHIHQVCSIEGKLRNHNPITDWFGPKISYVSFFQSWQKNRINHAPMFLEVKNIENCEISIKALEKVIKPKI